MEHRNQIAVLRGQAPASEQDCTELKHQPRNAPCPSDPLVLDQAAALFRALGDTSRLRLLERLAGGEYCVTELAAEFDEGISTISQRLKILRAEGIVRRRREGKHIYYSLRDHHISALIASAIEHAQEDDEQD